MPDFKQIKICDPLYAYIYLEPWEKSIIQHPAFQRLRSVGQLGFSEQAFPSGIHNRFTHSLGVCHLAGQAFDSIFIKNEALLSNLAKKQKFRKTVRIAALLHDIGHGPLSHSSESFMPPVEDLNLGKFLNTKPQRMARHEDYGVKFIMEDKELYKMIQDAGVEPEAVAQLLHRDCFSDSDFFSEGDLNFLPVLRQIISSEFDVDRMDYLYRDSLYCGVRYGFIDFVWLISHFDCHIEKGQVFLAIGKEGLYTLESLILGRQHMRLIVYFHHKSAIYNQMLKNYSAGCNWKLPADLPSYQSWTDGKLFEKLKQSSNIWAKRIIEQKAYLRLYESASFEPSSEEKGIEFLKKTLKEKKIDFISIDSEKHSIKSHKSILKKYNIYLKNRTLNQTQILHDSGELLDLPQRKIQRLYVSPEQFSIAQSILKEFLACLTYPL